MNWLQLYQKYTEAHEAPSLFHLWTGVATIMAVLERKVHCPVMFDDIYPNLYIILVAPPGRCRKGSSMMIGARLLEDARDEGLSIHVCPEMITREALIRQIAECQTTYEENGNLINHCSLTAISTELDTIMSSNPGDMLKLLIELFDAQLHDIFVYKTKGSGTDTVRGLWFSLFGATVPSFFKTPDLQKSIGQGFTSRCIFVYACEKRFQSKLCIDDIGERLATSKRLQDIKRRLVKGLVKINSMTGEFDWTDNASEFFNKWYDNLPKELKKEGTIEHLQPYYERKHVHAIKLAMILSASEDYRDMVIHTRHIRSALRMLEDAETYMPRVFSGTGRSTNVEDVERLLNQFERNRSMTMQQIYRLNYRDISLDQMKAAVQGLIEMGVIKADFDQVSGKVLYKWKDDGTFQM